MQWGPKIILAFAAVFVTFSAAGTPTIVEAVWEKELVRAGDGEWDLRSPRDPESGEFLDERPITFAVDNKGNIIICDIDEGRLLTFTTNGDRLAIIDVSERLSVVYYVWVDEKDQLYLWGLTPDYKQYREVTIQRTPAGHETQVLDPDSVELGPGAALWYRDSRQLEPLGYDGQFGVRVEVDGQLKYQAVDRDGRFIQFIPSLYRDQKGRFYDLHLDALRVYDAQGELQAQIEVPMARYLMQYDGWVYVCCGNHHLYRYGETGDQEDDITTKPNSPALWSPVLAAPRADFLYTLNAQHSVERFAIGAKRWRKGEAEPK